MAHFLTAFHTLGPEDVLATVYHVLGIDPVHTFVDHTGRPVALFPRGEAIRELV